MKTRLLLVDDEKEFIGMLSQRLEARGFEVTTALSGEQALERVGEQDVDVVILDVAMPGKDGMSTLKEIKALKPLISVIMLTGHATVETAIEGMKRGAFDYLMKPTDMRDLVEKITRAAELKTAHEERIRKAEIEGILKRKGW